MGECGVTFRVEDVLQLQVSVEDGLLRAKNVAVPDAEDANGLVFSAEEGEVGAEILGSGSGEVDGVIWLAGEEAGELDALAFGGLPVGVEGVDFGGEDFNLGVGINLGLGELFGEAADLGRAPKAVGRVVEVREIVGSRCAKGLSLPQCGFDLVHATGEPCHLIVGGDVGSLGVVENSQGLGAERLTKVSALMVAMDGLYGLFKANGDEQADDDGGDVNEELSPAGCSVGCRMNVEHSGSSWIETFRSLI